MTLRPAFLAVPIARVAPLRRRLGVVPAVLLAAFAAACGGGDGGGTTNPTVPSTAFRLDVAAQATLASGTTGLTVRIIPTYERTSGERVALATQTAAITGGAAQTLPFTVDLAPCLNDAARRGADQGTGANAVCILSAAVSLQTATRSLDSVGVGPFTVKGGTSGSATVSFVEVASVSVTRTGGAAVGTQPVALQLGQTLTLVATPLDPSGAALARTVTWTSSVPGVATVANGVVTPVGFGTTRITAAAGGRETAVDVVVQPTLTVTIVGAGGTVTSAPAGINCASGVATGCAAAFAPGASVTLTAASGTNGTFSGWSGACTGTGACTVALDQARAVTATFTPRRVTLTVGVSGTGTGDVLVTGGNVSPAATPCATASCTFTVDAGGTVNLTARAGTGSTAGVWSGACAGTAAQPCAITPTADASVGVTFVPRPVADTASISATGPAGAGGALGVTGFVNGQPTASQFSFNLTTASPITGLAFDPGSPITLRFQPDPSWRLVSWSGPCAGAAIDPVGVSSCTYTSTRTSQVVLTLAPR